jgi:hypothetical protein
MNQYIELAKKLKRLAERGEGGERYNAQRQLDRIMAKHDISKEDLEEDVLHMVKFKVTKDQFDLFVQVARSLVNDDRPLRRMKKKPSIIFAEITKLEEAEIRGKWGFYWRVYQEQRNIFYRAFIMKHQIFNPNSKGKNVEDLTPKERREAMAAMRVSMTLDGAVYHKPLSF